MPNSAYIISILRELSNFSTDYVNNSIFSSFEKKNLEISFEPFWQLQDPTEQIILTNWSCGSTFAKLSLLDH